MKVVIEASCISTSGGAKARFLGEGCGSLGRILVETSKPFCPRRPLDGVVQRRKGEPREWNELLKAAGWGRGTACAPGKIVCCLKFLVRRFVRCLPKSPSWPSIKNERFALDIGHTRRTEPQILTRAVLWDSCFTSFWLYALGLEGVEYGRGSRQTLPHSFSHPLGFQISIRCDLGGKEEVLNCLWFLHWLGQTYLILYWPHF